MSLRVLLDQNISYEIKTWLKAEKPNWEIIHTSDINMATEKDSEIYLWAQKMKATIITFDDDFADRRSFPVTIHAGIIRLKVWPTTIEETQKALARLIAEFSVEDIRGSFVIIDRNKIRLRK